PEISALYLFFWKKRLAPAFASERFKPSFAPGTFSLYIPVHRWGTYLLHPQLVCQLQ
uniref:Uncharacterized protein n=1 Tax=Aegilops tauschii subsp. strangulata TaxID=200361 RepID=A0A453KB52_AEGTS